MQPTQHEHQYSQLNLEDNSVNQNSREISIKFNKSKSLRFKIFHGTHAMLGGLFLIAASCMYFAEMIKRYPMALTVGGWLFSIGSFFLLLADLQDSWYNRVGCCFDRRYRDVCEISSNTEHQYSRSSTFSQLERTDIRMNDFMAACGSPFYLAGSILLLPYFERYAILGNCLIIAGSATIFLCASWKIYQTGYINVADPSDHKFHLGNIFSDISTIMIDISVGLGSVFYFFGVIFFLPSFITDDFGMNRSAVLCVLGGVFFFLASIFLQFRYYCKK